MTMLVQSMHDARAYKAGPAYNQNSHGRSPFLSLSLRNSRL
jgi:hypothetical protein